MWLINKKNLPIILIVGILLLGTGIITIILPKINSYRIEKHQEEGRNYLKDDNYEMAKESFTKLLELGSLDYFTFYGLGISYFMEDDYDTAEKYFFRALGGKSSKNLKARIYSELGSVCLFKGEYEKALKYLEEVVYQKIDSEVQDETVMAVAYSKMGTIYMLLGDFEKSLESFNKSLELEIDDQKLNSENRANTYVGLGSYYFTIGDFEKAEDIFEEGLKFDPSFPIKVRLYLGLGKTYLSLKNYEKSIPCLKEGLTVLQEFDKTTVGISFIKFEIYNELGKSYLNLENYSLAKEYFNNILEIKEDIKYNAKYEQAFAETVANLGLGDCYLEEGNINKALDSFEDSLASLSGLEPKFSNEKININFFSILLHYKLSVVNYEKGDIVSAKKEISKASDLIAYLHNQNYFIIEKVQWFKDTDSLFQKVSSLKNELEG